MTTKVIQTNQAKIPFQKLCNGISKLNHLFSAYLYNFDNFMDYTFCKRVLACMETWKQCTLVLAATDE